MRPRDGVLLVAHGTVENLDDLGAFLARIRGGRPAPPGFVEELRGRYEAIGGSPLLSVTQAQADALRARLGVPVLVGMRLWDPSVEAALEQAGAAGLERLCVLPLAPFSVHVYWQAAERSQAAVRARGASTPELVSAPAWGTHPAFVAAHATAIRARAHPEALVVLTAHSLPLVALRSGDPYERLVRESAEAIGAQLGRPFELAFQSQGEGTAEWLGPDLPAVLGRARADGVRRVAIAPFGFLGEHVETLYDLDIEARRIAGDLGLEFERVPALGTAAGLIDALEELARRTLA
jgi:ferrochelatase